MKSLFILVYLIFTLFAWESFAQIRFAFGSCHDQNKGGNHFKNISQESVQAWIWLGDNIYSDHFSDKQRKNAYTKVKKDIDYSKINQKMKVWGTWDDHDYGYNNVGSNYVGKSDSKKRFLEFLDFPDSDPVYSREGIYHQRRLESNGMSAKFVMLDLRYFQTRSTLLGREQWSWLEDVFNKADEDIIILVSSLNVMSELSIFTLFLEGWHRWKKERERLFKLISRSAVPVVFLSGDRHFSDRSLRTINGGKRIYEFMSSGLNKPGRPLPSRYRLGKAVDVPNYATVEIYKENGSERLKILHHIKRSDDGSVISSLDTYLN